MKTSITLIFCILVFSLTTQTLLGQIHFQTQVNKSENDAEENRSNGSMNLTSSDIELCYDPGVIGIGSKDQYVGIRFESIDVPKTAIIDSAFIQFTADGTTSNPTIVEVHGELMFNSPAYSGLDYNISSRTRTSDFVNWNIPEWNTSDSKTEIERTPDLKDLVSEIIQQVVWQQNNSMSFIIEGSGTRRAYSWDGSSSQAAELHIYYKENNASTESNELAQIQCYPNPAKNYVYIDLSKESSTKEFHIQLYTIDGREIERKTVVGGQKYKIDFDLRNTMVIAKMIAGNEVRTQKIIIR